MEKGYYKTKDSVEEYIQAAKGVDGGEHIEKFKKFLSLNSSVLEIGSGPGTDWKILSEDYRVLGSDNSKEFISHLIASYPSGRFIKLDAVSIDIDKKFDGIYTNKVLHHLKNNELINSIKRQYDILNSEGIICHSFWKGSGNETFKGLFVNYHSEKSLREFFEPYFETLLLESYAEFEQGDSILFIGKKKENIL